MHCGFFFWPYTPEYTKRMVRLGEDLGFDLVGIADTPGNAMDLWVAMTLAAGASQRVRLASCVTNLLTRHPAITAGAAASVDAVAGGRTILGVGAGHSGVANVGGTPAGLRALRDGIAELRGLLAGSEWVSPAAAAQVGAPSGVASQQPGGVRRRVPVYAAASGPGALRAAGAVADGVFINYGLQREHVARAAALVNEGAAEARRDAREVDAWWVACLDCGRRRETTHEKLGNILGFVAAYILGRDPEGRGVPPELVPAVRELRQTYTTRQREMDPGLIRRLGLFDYLRGRLAVAGTPEDCLEQARAAVAAGAEQLMFTVSLAADPESTVELFGREVLPALRT
jgi:5,10-methylenetetrahydromethanopterin reductase